MPVYRIIEQAFVTNRYIVTADSEEHAQELIENGEAGEPTLLDWDTQDRSYTELKGRD